MEKKPRFGAYVSDHKPDRVKRSGEITERAGAFLEQLDSLAREHGTCLKYAVTVMLTADGGFLVSGKGLGRDDMPDFLEAVANRYRTGVAGAPPPAAS